MSLVGDAVAAMKGVVVLNEKVNRTGQLLDELVRELREHDRRLVRLETMVEIARDTQRLYGPDRD